MSDDTAGSRLDTFLAQVGPDLSRSRARQLIDAGDATVNGARRKPAHVLKAGDRVTLVSRAAPTAGVAPAPDVPVAVLSADDALIVVNKQAGLVVHPGAGHAANTLVNGLVSRFPDLRTAFADDDERPGIVHRLDRETSGVMIVARTPAAAAELIAQFRARSVRKVYLALVAGRPDPREAVIDAPIGRDRADRQRMAAVKGGKPATTRYKVIAGARDCSLLEIRPVTGRTHQIRVHLALVGHPIVGDAVYGGRRRKGTRLALHAWRLVLRHPSTGREVTFEAPIPEDFMRRAAERGLELPAP